MQVCCKTLEPPHWFRVSVGPHGNVMGAVADINSCRMGMYYR
jgi:hypothetical protein